MSKKNKTLVLVLLLAVVLLAAVPFLTLKDAEFGGFHGLCSIPSTPVNSIANINFRRKHLRFITPSVPFAERRIIGMIKEMIEIVLFLF